MRNQRTAVVVGVLALAALVAMPAAAQVYVKTNFLGVGIDTPLTPFHLVAPGQTQFLFESSMAGNPRWNFKINANGHFAISKLGTPGEITVRPANNTEGFTLQVTGTAAATAHVNISSRAFKENFEPLDGEAVLARVADLPISEWNFKGDLRETRRIGPMAEDFYEAFGVGMDNRHISLGDMGGVALAAIQGLNAQSAAKDVLIAELLQRIEALESRLGD